MEKPPTSCFSGSSTSHQQKKVLFLDNGAYNIKAMYLALEQLPCHSSCDNLTSVCASTPLFLTLPHCVGASPYAGRGLIGREVLGHLPHYHSLLLRRPCTRRGGFLLDGLLEAYVWEHILQRFSIEDERTVDVWLTVPFGVPKQVGRVLLALVTERFHFSSLTVISSTFLSLIASEAGDSPFQRLSLTGENLHTSGTTTTCSSLCGCGVVVDAGFSCTTIVPYLDYLPITTSIVRLDVGGKLLTNRLKEYLSFTQVNLMEEEWIVNHIKEKCCFVAENPLSMSHLYKHPDIEIFSYLMKKKDERKHPQLSKHPLYHVRGNFRTGGPMTPIVQLYYLPSVQYLQPLGKTAEEMSHKGSNPCHQFYYDEGGWNHYCNEESGGKVVANRLESNALSRGSQEVRLSEEDNFALLELNKDALKVRDKKGPLKDFFFCADADESLHCNPTLGNHLKKRNRDSLGFESSVFRETMVNPCCTRKHNREHNDLQNEKKRTKTKKGTYDTEISSSRLGLKKVRNNEVFRPQNKQEHPVPFLPYLFLQQECTSIPEIIFAPGSIGIPQCGLAEAIGLAIFSRGLLSTLPLLQSNQSGNNFNFSTSLLSRVVICGGTSNFRGFRERLQKDLEQFHSSTSSLSGIISSAYSGKAHHFEDEKSNKLSNQKAKRTNVSIIFPTYFSCVNNSSFTQGTPLSIKIPHFLDGQAKSSLQNVNNDGQDTSYFPLSAAEIQPLKGAYFLLSDPRFSSQLKMVQNHSYLQLSCPALQRDITSRDSSPLSAKVEMQNNTFTSYQLPHCVETSGLCKKPSIENLMEKLEQLW